VSSQLKVLTPNSILSYPKSCSRRSDLSCLVRNSYLDALMEQIRGAEGMCAITYCTALGVSRTCSTSLISCFSGTWWHKNMKSASTCDYPSKTSELGNSN
jgi:hypothetical protein